MTKLPRGGAEKSSSGAHPVVGNGRSADRQFRQDLYDLRRFLRAGRRKRDASDDAPTRRNGGRGRVRIGEALAQRVLVKGRVVKTKQSRGGRALRAHLKYLTRSGVSFDGKQPTFFCDGRVVTEDELAKSVATWAHDAHHFRFIVSPEKGAELDLPAYTRDVMASVQRDLKTRLEWYGVCHYNTDNPHVHVLVRGVTELGAALIIEKDYMKHGFRLAAEAEATRVLGRRSALEKRIGMTRSITEKRFTALDRAFVKEQRAHRAGLIFIPAGNLCRREWEVKLRLDKLSRLQFLGTLGLAVDHGNGRFEVAKDLEETLRTLGRHEAIRKQVHDLTQGRSAAQELVIHDARDNLDTKLTGEVIAKELTDELTDRKFVLLSSDDGRLHYVPLSTYSEPEGFGIRPGALVTIREASRVSRADEAIARYVGNGGGVFSLSGFEGQLNVAIAKERWSLPEDLSMDEYLERFRTRCKSLVEHGICTPNGIDSWRVPKDFRAKVTELDKKLSVQTHLEVQAESFLSLAEQTRWKGATWLDVVLGQPESAPDPRTALGASVAKSLELRQQTLKEQGIVISSGLVAELYKAERQALAGEFSGKLGTERTLRVGESVTGAVYEYKMLGLGHHMVVRLKDSFVVVPVSGRQRRFESGTKVKIEGGGRVLSRTGLNQRFRVTPVKSPSPDLRQGIRRTK